jgi:hypothetical protein
MDVDMDVANIPVSPTSLHSIKFDDTDYITKCGGHDNDTYFCGLCHSDVWHQMGQGGKWQQYGDWMQNEKRWVFLCSSCLGFLWRLYSKDEGDLRDLQLDRFNKDFMIFLKVELEKRRKS